MRVNIKKIIDLRQKLHKFAELSGKEEKTKEILKNYFKQFKPTQVIDNLGDNSLAFVFDSGKAGKTLVFRAELDALPIDETLPIPYRSSSQGISHKCGHDGHMAILTGLAEAVANEKPEKGKVVFLFQSAEETLRGAQKIMDDPKFKEINPDFIIGFHNLPFYDENTIIIKAGNFSSATIGMKIEFFGKPAHAAHPEKGNSPLEATINLINEIKRISESQIFKNFVLASITHLNVGIPNYGVMPDHSTLMTTLRSFDYADLDKFIGEIQDLTKKIAKKYNLQFKISYSDDAPPIYNDPQITKEIVNLAEQNNFDIVIKDTPMREAEDFGYFTLRYKGVFFGIGNGLEIDLHNQNYDFPDNIILRSIEFLFLIYKKFIKS